MNQNIQTSLTSIKLKSSQCFARVLFCVVLALFFAAPAIHGAEVTVTDKKLSDGTTDYYFKNLSDHKVKVTFSRTSKFGDKKTQTETRTLLKKETEYITNSQISTPPRIIQEQVLD